MAGDLQNHTPEAEADVSASKNNTKKAKLIVVEHFIGLGQQHKDKNDDNKNDDKKDKDNDDNNDGPEGCSLYCLNLNCRVPPGRLLQPDLIG